MQAENPPVPPNFWGEPELPNGSTGLPIENIFVHQQSASLHADSAFANPNDTSDSTPAQHPPAANDIYASMLTDDVLSAYNADQRLLLREFVPYIWGKHSEYLDRVVNSFQYVLEHAQACVAEQVKAQPAQRRARVKVERTAEQDAAELNRKLMGDRWLKWQHECQLRKQWIEGKRLELANRRAQAKAAETEWERYVAEAKKDYEEARVVPAPARPV